MTTPHTVYPPMTSQISQSVRTMSKPKNTFVWQCVRAPQKLFGRMLVFHTLGSAYARKRKPLQAAHTAAEQRASGDGQT